MSLETLFDERGILALVFQGTWVTHLVLIVLILMSSISWAIIALKWLQFRRLVGENEEFFHLFSKEHKMEHIYNLSKQFESSAFAYIFKETYKEAMTFRERMRRQAQNQDLSNTEILQRLNQRLERVFSRSITQQLGMIDHRLSVLATISSAAPFVGLFGTVLGIIDSFQSIGTTGVTSLSVVAPGISEALVATAAGLLAAIPALMAYNHYRNAARRESNSMRDFALELGNRMEWIVS